MGLLGLNFFFHPTELLYLDDILCLAQLQYKDKHVESRETHWHSPSELRVAAKLMLATAALKALWWKHESLCTELLQKSRWE